MKLKTLKDFFLERQKEQPLLGAYINLCYTVHRSGASMGDIKRAFLELIPKNEYDREEQTELVAYLYKKASETGEESVKEPVNKSSTTVLHSNTPYIK